MIPAQCPEFRFDRPPEYGGLLSVFPIVTKDQQYGLFNEVRVAQYGADSGIWQPGGHGPSAWLDRPVFNGEVWTVQRNALPGYYVSPQELLNAVPGGTYWDSSGVGDFLGGSGWQTFGNAPIG